MSAPDLLLAIDQGTTSTRAIAFDYHLRPVASASRSLRTRHPQPGWFEQDAEHILESVVATVERVIAEIGGPGRIAAAGLDNQGETVVAWDAESGQAVAPAILWQCRRSLPVVESLRAAGLEPRIRATTGLPLDPYFSAGKMTWLLEHHDGVQKAAQRGTLRMGTVDAWLTAQLDGGDARTDASTASRTQLFSLTDLTWNRELLDWFGIDPAVLPRVVASAGELGMIEHPRWGGAMPLRAMACDQQAGLAGQAGFAAGAMKATLGTGAFILANAGTRPPVAPSLEASVAWILADGRPSFVLQGGVFAAGSFISWLRDDLGVIRDAAELSRLAGSVPDSGGLRVLPAPAGLGAPWWRPEARTVLAGASGGTGRGHLARATLDGIANLMVDVLEVMAEALPAAAPALRVDGGLASSPFLVQRLADLWGRPIDVAGAIESTALGIAGLAGLGAGIVGMETIAAANPIRDRVEPGLASGERGDERASWRRFVQSTAGLGT